MCIIVITSYVLTYTFGLIFEMDRVPNNILRTVNTSPGVSALVTTGVCASVFLRNVRMGKLGLVKNSLLLNIAALPVWFMDFLLDIATGGILKSFVYNMRIATRGLLSVSSDESDSTLRVNPQVAANHGTLITSPESDIFTLHDLVTRAFEKYSDFPCVGSRDLLEYRVIVISTPLLSQELV